MMKFPNMKPPADEELGFALNKGSSYMTLMIMKELNENLYKKETIEKERATTNIEIPDEIFEKIVDNVTEIMWCNFGTCHMEQCSWKELEEVREYIKTEAMHKVQDYSHHLVAVFFLLFFFDEIAVAAIYIMKKKLRITFTVN